MGQGIQKRVFKRWNINGWETLLACVEPLAIRKMQIKTTLRVHLSLIRMAKIKHIQTNNKRTNAGMNMRMKDIYSWLLGMKASAFSMEIPVEIPPLAENRYII